MRIVTQAQALEDLKHHFPAFYEFATGAWDDCRNLPTKDLSVFTFRTKSSAIHDYMVARAAVHCETVEDMKPFKKNGMKGILVAGKYAIRFKKLDEDGRSKNQPTQQVKQFRSQIQLEGIEAEHHLELGYVTNAFQTEVLDVRLVCPSGELSNAWAESIGESVCSPVIEDIFAEFQDSEIGETEIAPKGVEEKEGKVIPFRKEES
jgi:hypothetical protein